MLVQMLVIKSLKCFEQALLIGNVLKQLMLKKH